MTSRLVVLVVLCWPVLVFGGVLGSGEGWLAAEGQARVFAERALRTQRYTTGHLANLPRLERCGWVPFVGYERNDGSPLSDSWYNAAQLQADAAMVGLGQSGRMCVLNRTAAFFDVVAAPAPPGGFWPRADVDGRHLASRDIYGDDNALIGLALLEARAASRDEVWRARLLEQAEHAASFLIDGPMWDETFGGGFWWNSNRGRMPEGKPSQTAALAAQLFLRLYEATGRSIYVDWARASVAWLDARLLDPATGLYLYTLRHWDMPGQSGEYLDRRVFSYDQGIMIEVFVLFDRLVESRAGYLQRARALAEALHPLFWEPELGGYRVAADQPDVAAGYAAWLTQSLLALHAVDPDPRWLARAEENLEALEQHLLEPTEGSYSNLYFRCDGRQRSGCESGAGWSYDPTKYLASQAWMQRAQALLAARLSRLRGRS